MINTDGEEETGKSWMGRGHWVTIQFLPINDMHINEEISYKTIKATLHLDTMEYVPFYFTSLFKR